MELIQLFSQQAQALGLWFPVSQMTLPDTVRGFDCTAPGSEAHLWGGNKEEVVLL